MKKRNQTSKISDRPNTIVGHSEEIVNMLTVVDSAHLNDGARTFRRFTRAVFAAHAAVLRHGDAMNARFQQSAARWRVLIRIEMGDVSASAIARVTGYSRQSVQRLLAELETEGLARRVTDSADQRRLRPQLTKTGREVLRGMEAGFNAWAPELVAQLQAARLDQTSEVLENVATFLQSKEATVKEKRNVRPERSSSISKSASRK